MNYQQPVLQSSVSHDHSEFIGAQETFLGTFVINLLNVFYEYKVQRYSIYLKYKLFVLEIICNNV